MHSPSDRPVEDEFAAAMMPYHYDASTFPFLPKRDKLSAFFSLSVILTRIVINGVRAALVKQQVGEKRGCAANVGVIMA